MQAPSASYSLTVRLEIVNKPGMLGRVTSAIGKAGGDIGAIDLVVVGKSTITRDITFKASDESHGQQVVDAIRAVQGVKVGNVSDRTFLMHLGGKIEVRGKMSVKTRDDLSMAYTPGVARVCMAIHHDPEKAYALTIKQNAVAVVTDGTAVLGLGDIGPSAAQPVMEGKALIFKEFAGVDAFPVCLATKDPDEIVAIVKAIAPVFGGINLEDISAPRCFDIEQKLQRDLEIPVFHDDQHGTAVVVLAALLNALKIVKKRLSDARIVFTGAGASGIATAKLLMRAGAKHIIACDRAGALYRGRVDNMNPMKEWFAKHTNEKKVRGTAGEALEGADVFIGLSGPGVVALKDIKAMNRDPIVFAMANPIPEIMPEEAGPHVRVMATGRSDYPNQINNSCCFPGFFRGMLDVRARRVNDEMKLAAAHALAAIVSKEELSEEYITPSMFDSRVVPAVAAAVADAAIQTGVARRRPRAAAAEGRPRHGRSPAAVERSE
ncbi:MAG: NAD-dependent malic enzyme [Candidatus Rokuibacteriota bacterium]|jgi:malate dehydrogenase (oxaloacetate-decarboxylating)|nr:MAG: NAD-dependent malic enzyme [Candidatus Rokubacteria bacterium 13_2_20CM_69_15_1]OLB52921.1 MAG: NAD-dependent malic enzyme [Candidatus Rokubacteria bacterium 13_2_20CM_2_70_11]PYN35748.1 MAG: NAD-dependent malic enzyme [Candidatus Rokubacteria bacterium]